MTAATLTAERPGTRPAAAAMPAAARLAPSFNAGWLAAELRRVCPPSDDWRSLVLRAPGGRALPGIPADGPDGDWTDTPWLERLPHTRYILKAVPAPVVSARFLCRAPGSGAVGRIEAAQGPYWGTARLHVPVETNAQTLLLLDGEVHRWNPGDLWFGDFTRTHQVRNQGSEHSVHLALDVLLTEPLARLFPVAWRDWFRSGDVLVNRIARPVAQAALEAPPRAFELPSAFFLREHADPLDGYAAAQRAVLAPEPAAGRMVLRLASGRTLPLVHVGGEEYRFAGRSEERTLQTRGEGARAEIVLRARAGRHERQRTVPLRTP
ncbi:aspartyl/asparaginyl beta-hydroxylase domain-containing protein [Streptomyces sp. NBC_01244]|uniref:aspartyl/asparaginyl beta-hydroxylase domain-containing protein n=1 Tax=Streptomyces sp. NBC_01244 TaxID=2903797 RepID=UPI002E11FECC|nr:aspartyl/asparaginyl beta-hydroxylase domain-containing protein [Streptomyces sp. NBC_01244]